MDMSRLDLLSTDMLQEMNKTVVAILNSRRANETWDKARQFRVGQLVQFNDKYGRARKITIERINTKTISGRELGTLTNWRVHPSFLSAV